MHNVAGISACVMDTRNHLCDKNATPSNERESMSAPRNAGAELLSLATMNVHALQRNSGISLVQGKTSKKRHSAGPAADRRRAATAGGASRGDSQLVLPGEATTARSPTTSRLLKACIRQCCTLAVDSVEETFPQHNEMRRGNEQQFRRNNQPCSRFHRTR